MRSQIYRPGAGIAPPFLAGRDQLLAGWMQALDMHSRGRYGHDHVLTGLRGVGKSVLLTEMRTRAEGRGFATIALQAPADGTLVESLGRQAASQQRGSRWGEVLERFNAQVSLSLTGPSVQAGISSPTARTDAPTRDMNVVAGLLADLASASGSKGLVITVDELQMADAADLRVLGATLNQLNTAHSNAPVLFAGAGLPNLPQRMIGHDPDHPVITNPERLFRFRTLEPTLELHATEQALREPARAIGSDWSVEAVEALHRATGGSPALIQIHAAAAWSHGTGTSPVTLDDVQATGPQAEAEVVAQFLQGRWNRLTPRQQEYLVAATLSEGRTNPEIAHIAGRVASETSRERSALIKRGELYEDTTQTVALTMPAMGPYALAQYPYTVARTNTDLATATEMLSNTLSWQTKNPPQAVEHFPHEILQRVQARNTNSLVQRAQQLGTPRANPMLEPPPAPEQSRGHGLTR